MYDWGSSSAVAEGRRGREHMHPGTSREGVPIDGCGNFFATRNIQNSVSSVEAEMGTEVQIMCIEQCTF